MKLLRDLLSSDVADNVGLKLVSTLHILVSFLSQFFGWQPLSANDLDC
jgi:hypothetical protein